MNITTMTSGECTFRPFRLLQLQSWMSPAFPIGSYSYSHAIEWAVEEGWIRDRESLVNWLEADLRYGSGRNEAIFFAEAWKSATNDDLGRLRDISELAATLRGTAEFALESLQQGTSCLSILREICPDVFLTRLHEKLDEQKLRPSLAVVLGVCTARNGIPLNFALAAFLHNLVANLVNAGVRLIPLGQTDGQIAVCQLQRAVIKTSEHGGCATLDDLGSAAFMVDVSSMAHETQYTRLFRS
jgi:urease accessory protein